jgi:DNA-binding winged helix-turn-helix (wHTH) protein
MTTPPAQSKERVSFGPFNLVPSERRLTKGDVRVELSGRAYDILVTLLSRPNEVVSKTDLIAQVWPGITVEEGSLRFHVAGLRKALGDGKEGARYISTSSGRGYSFVAPISRSSFSAQPPVEPSADFHHYNLPGRFGVMIDREEDLEKLSIRLNAHRFVTIVGSGGVGKTTVAVAIAHQLHATFNGAVLFVDLSMVSDPRFVTTGVASMLGLSVQTEDVTSGLIAYLRDKRILLVLDTCEHLINAVAALAAQSSGPRRRSTSSRRAVKRCRSTESTSTDWSRSPTLRTTASFPPTPREHFLRRNCSSNAQWPAEPFWTRTMPTL